MNTLREHKNTFTKEERLCSKILIDELIKSKLSFVSFPFRVVYKISSIETSYPARIMFSVPKKRFKRAVDRNLIKRKCKEAYRLAKHEHLYTKINNGTCIDIMFIYITDNTYNYSKIEQAIIKSLHKITKKL